MIPPSSRAGWRRLKKDAANIIPIEKPKKESNVELEKSDLERITVAPNRLQWNTLSLQEKHLTELQEAFLALIESFQQVDKAFLKV
jgi:hypothetical protein